jgi:hypothetical protein
MIYGFVALELYMEMLMRFLSSLACHITLSCSWTLPEHMTSINFAEVTGNFCKLNIYAQQMMYYTKPITVLI